MAQSLVKLTLESNQYEKNLRQAKRSLDDFTKQIGINTKALSGVAVAAAAVTGAMKVMKDAFMASEKMVDEWGRTIESVKSVYEGFLNGLNNSDISGFLGRIDQIVKAAREAYDAIDTLGTLKTIQSPQIAKRQAENDRLRAMLQTGRYIAPAQGSGLNATMATGTLLSDSQKRDLERQLENGMKEMVKLAGNEVKATGDAIDAVYNRFGAELGMSVKEFRQGTSSWEEFTKRLEGSKKYSQWQSENSFVDQNTGRLIAPRTGNPYSAYKGWDVFRVDGERYKELVQLIQQREQQIGQIYSMQGQAYRTINRTEGIRSRIGGGRSGSSIGGTADVYAPDSIAAQQALVTELTKKWQNAGAAVRDGYKKELEEAKNTLTNMIEGRNFLPVDMSGIKSGQFFTPGKEDINKMVAKLNLPRQDKQLSIAYADKELSNISSGIGSMVGSLEQLGVEIPEGLSEVVSGIQAVTTILSAITTIVSAIQAISAADMLIPFARGGIVPHAAGGWMVPGHDYSDRTPVMVSSGELILNKAQQGNLASQLEGGALGNLRLTATISGEQIRLALNNNGRRTGRGEMITAKFGG